MADRIVRREPAVPAGFGLTRTDPDLEIAFLGLIQQGIQLIETGLKTVQRQYGLTQLPPAMIDGFPDMGIIKQFPPPERYLESIDTMKIAVIQKIFLLPALEIFSLVITDISEAEIEIPDRPGYQFAAFAVLVLMKIGT